MVNERKWASLFGVNKRDPESEISQQHSNMALAIQLVTEEIVIKMAREAKRLTGADYVCLAGGVALNCVANGKLLKEGIFEDLFIQPAAGDAGGAVGAALAAYYLHFGKNRRIDPMDSMQGSYLGPSFSDKEIERAVKFMQADYTYEGDFATLAERVAGLLDEGKVVGWFQGRMEFGPRALGNRSILGDARNKEMQKKLNLKIKYRESFRPFAPSVLGEDVDVFFDLKTASPYMLLVAQVNASQLKDLPANYNQLPLMERLYVERSGIPAITHIDLSARIQTVHQHSNKRYHALIEAFKQKTGVGVIVNTSFNVRGEPIVCTPEDAYRCFMRTEMDFLVMGDYFFDKQKQAAWDKNDKWKEDFKLD
jgi:carbamoyltransferase